MQCGLVMILSATLVMKMNVSSVTVAMKSILNLIKFMIKSMVTMFADIVTILEGRDNYG